MSINVDIKIPNIINDNIINNKIKGSLYKSTLDETNPIVIQLIEFGYDRIYSRRVFHYLHPDDIEEALNYMSEENGIIQHRFVQNRRDIENDVLDEIDKNASNKEIESFESNKEFSYKEKNFINTNKENFNKT